MHSRLWSYGRQDTENKCQPIINSMLPMPLFVGNDLKAKLELL